jgi:hypothetical protein
VWLEGYEETVLKPADVADVGGVIPRVERRIISTLNSVAAHGLHLSITQAQSVMRHGAAQAALGQRVLSGEWVHLAFVYDLARKQATIYHNAELVGTQSGVQPLVQSTPVLIGCCDSEWQVLNGVLSELRIWTVARTPDQIELTMRRSTALVQGQDTQKEAFDRKQPMWTGLSGSWSFSAGSLFESVRGRAVGVEAGPAASSTDFSPQWLPVESLAMRESAAQKWHDSAAKLAPVLKKLESVTAADANQKELEPKEKDNERSRWALDLTARNQPILLGGFGKRKTPSAPIALLADDLERFALLSCVLQISPNLVIPLNCGSTFHPTQRRLRCVWLVQRVRRVV